jgi:hypothetical protein
MVVATVVLQAGDPTDRLTYGALNLVPDPGTGSGPGTGPGPGTDPDLPCVLFHMSPRLQRAQSGAVRGSLVRGIKRADGTWKTQTTKVVKADGGSPLWAGEASVEVRLVVVVGHGLAPVPGTGCDPPVGLALFLDEVFSGVTLLPPAGARALGTAHLEVPLGGDAREVNHLCVRECVLGRRAPDAVMLAALADAVEAAAPITGKFLVEGLPKGLEDPRAAVAALFSRFAKDPRVEAGPGATGTGTGTDTLVASLPPGTCTAELRDLILAELGHGRAFVAWCHPETGVKTKVHVTVTAIKA